MTLNLRDDIHQMHAHLCSALADPNRIMILYCLRNNSINVTTLADELDLPQPTVSRHLKVLRESNLVERERVGHSVIYELTEKRVIDALDLLRGVLADSLQRQSKIARTAAESLSALN
ncbi:MAG: metalloregulator ArsR/SmtB family transcription factor [Chloroflexi bacterium]|nr:metalloregulator ArsR/SmtB family transcription factor [Chloroflexota bacterium]